MNKTILIANIGNISRCFCKGSDEFCVEMNMSVEFSFSSLTMSVPGAAVPGFQNIVYVYSAFQCSQRRLIFWLCVE